MKSIQVRLGVRRILFVVAILALLLALILPAIRILADQTKPFHNHVLKHEETGEIIIWYHPNSFLARYWPELIGRIRSNDRVCERTEQRRQLYPGFSDLDASYDAAVLIQRVWMLQANGGGDIVFNIKLNQKPKMPQSGEIRSLRFPDRPLRSPDFYDDTQKIE